MRLRNKKTGEKATFVYLQNDYISPLVLTVDIDGEIKMLKYNSLAELNNDWEDAPEEPKAFGWRIDEYNDPEEIGFGFSLEELEYLKEIGLWFKTKEEAEKAVEKLKALKRLKDKGFRFVGWRGDVGKHHLDGVAWYEMRLCGGYNIETADDLEALFGPEEKE